MRLRPPRGHVFIVPEEEDKWLSEELNILRHPDYTPIQQTAVVRAVGPPIEEAKIVRGKRVKIVRHAEVKAGDRLIFPFKNARADLGHEFVVNGVPLRSFTFAQIDNCVVIEDKE